MDNIAILNGAREEIISRLMQNRPLVKKYGEEEIKRRAYKNIKTIQTNVIDQEYLGWCSLFKPEITLATKEENSSILTMDDIILDEIKYETLIHEGVHAVLKRGHSTGMLRTIVKMEGNYGGNSKEEIYAEMGRGFNEGLTNWLVEKCGVNTTTYPFFTSLCKQLEFCIGEDAMMDFTQGNYTVAFKLLNIDEKEGAAFFKLLDEFYLLEMEETTPENTENMRMIIDSVERKIISCLVEGRMDNPQNASEACDIILFIRELEDILDMYGVESYIDKELSYKILPAVERINKRELSGTAIPVKRRKQD